MTEWNDKKSTTEGLKRNFRFASLCFLVSRFADDFEYRNVNKNGIFNPFHLWLVLTFELIYLINGWKFESDGDDIFENLMNLSNSSF